MHYLSQEVRAHCSIVVEKKHVSARHARDCTVAISSETTSGPLNVSYPLKLFLNEPFRFIISAVV